MVAGRGLPRPGPEGEGMKAREWAVFEATEDGRLVTVHFPLSGLALFRPMLGEDRDEDVEIHWKGKKYIATRAQIDAYRVEVA